MAQSQTLVQAWLSQVDFDYNEDGGSQEEQVKTFEDLIRIARPRVTSSRTKQRAAFIRQKLLGVVEKGGLNLSQSTAVFELLTLTYPRYHDRTSRQAVLDVLRALVASETASRASDSPGSSVGIRARIISWLAQEIDVVCKPGASSTASSNRFALLTWCTALYETGHSIPNFIGSEDWKRLVATFAKAYNSVLGDTGRRGLRQSATVISRRAVRKAHPDIPVLMKTLAELGLSNGMVSLPPDSAVPLAGLAVDVSMRLRGDVGKAYVKDTKASVLSLYANGLILSRSPLPQHALTALSEFVKTNVTDEDISDTIMPAAIKGFLRNPEISLNVMAGFVSAYPRPLPDNACQLMVTAVLNSVKSSNAATRQGASILFATLLINAPTLTRTSVKDILAILQTGKTASPEHRQALYLLLSELPESADVSVQAVETLIPLLPKEINEAALGTLSRSLTKHLRFCLQNNMTLKPELLKNLAKEMTNPKVILRRAVSNIIGGALLVSHLGTAASSTAEAFAVEVIPGLEAWLKAMSINPVNNPAGPLEGYVAVALVFGPLGKSGAKPLGHLLHKNAHVKGLLAVTPKPSFLLWDRVYKKTMAHDDESWLLNAITGVLHEYPQEIGRNEQLRVHIGSVFVHLAVESSHFETRREALATVQRCNDHHPQVINHATRDAVEAYFNQHLAKRPIASADDEAAKPAPIERLSDLLYSCVTFTKETSVDVKASIVTEWLLLAHFSDSSFSGRLSWIDLVQRAGLDPAVTVTDKWPRIIQLIDDVLVSTKPDTFKEAAIRSATTVAFVSGEEAVLRLLDRIREDLEPGLLRKLSKTDLEIWATPDGTTYIDVLSNKNAGSADKNRKEYEIEKWESELRQSLAKKQAAKTTGLSKQDRALFDAQLVKEAAVREHVRTLQRRAHRGLALIRALVMAETVHLLPHFSTITHLMLDGILPYGARLAGDDAFNTYLELSKCTASRIGDFRAWVGVATLRCYDLAVVPERFQVEHVSYLLARVLYRLRSLSEHTPFDPATFTYLAPLLNRLVSLGGIPSSTEDSESGLEQLALCLDIIKFHTSVFADPLYPRVEAASNLISLISGYSKLLQPASAALLEVGQAIRDTATPQEIGIFVRGTLMQEQYVRNACLQALQPVDLTDLDFSPELWIACSDDDEQNARLATHLWEDNGLDLIDSFPEQLLPFLQHDHAYVRASCARALAEAILFSPDKISVILPALRDLYLDKAKILTPEYDDYGMVIPESLNRADPWPVRVAIAETFSNLASSFRGDDVVPFFDFLLKKEALGDRSPDVRQAMLNAGASVVDLHGNTRLTGLIAMFEGYLAKSGKASDTQDYIKEAVIILFGRLARHLQLSDDRIPKIVDRLIPALKTPSEVVQTAVAECLPPLVRGTTVDSKALVDRLMDELVNAPKYAERRGAAYGIAGVMKGHGLSGMKDYRLLERLHAFVEDKKRTESRQGALFAIETLSATLGRLFEPYVIQILPWLLATYGDTAPDVREATQDATRVIMSKISGYGVKLILPSLLSGLDEKQWRTKRGSIEMLGAMAFCAPKELSLSLPTVIPRLTSVLTDSHAQVRAAANTSLKQFGEVISNPEIHSLVPVLLRALVDPATKTPPALRALLDTSFAHYIDSPSLALVVPIVERGLRERGADTKRRAAQIVGNLASLTDSRDFVPYLDRLIPLVRVVLVDPVPEARATAAKALGTLVERLGEVNFPDLMPSLLQTLKTDTSGVDRQGAAQGLSEVLSGLGMERLEALLPEVIANARSTRPYVREGFMSLLVYLPATFGPRFAPHIPRIIPPVLDGLADDEETVREAAMRAGRIVIANYSKTAIDLLLPELEQGMFDPGWRIRQSSVTLVGELLFKVSGISGKTEIEEEEEEGVQATGVEASRKVLVTALGKERRDRVLAALYIVRQDAIAVVRQASIHIWKALVHNTPRTVREILPALIDLEITLLASNSADQRETAARTMGELCRKLGEKILGAIVPILKAASGSNNARTREGVCLALCEIMMNTTDTQREDHEDGIVAAVRDSLVDESPAVRAAAAQAFDVLQERIGAKAIDQTIPTLLQALRQPGESALTALQALKEVMAVRAATVLPALLPTLLSTPMTSFNAQALKSLVVVAGRALSKRLNQILSSLIKALETEKDEQLRVEIQEAVEAILEAIADPEGLNTCMMLLLGWAKNESPIRRAGGARFFAAFCRVAQVDLSEYRIDWIRQLVSMLDDRQPEVVDAASDALDALVKSTDKEHLEALVVAMRRTIESTGAPGRHVLGFTKSKGIAPLVPVILAGLTAGTNEQKENAAYAIGDIVERSSEAAIKPYVVQLTGPLIRVITQATTFPPQVKSAILSSLTVMLTTIPTFVKPFFPQLQRTFIKSSSDPASLAVRNRAGTALGVLMGLQTRVDPVVSELITGVKTSEPDIRSSLAVALAAVVKNAGKNIGETSRNSLLELVADAFSEGGTDSYLVAVADILAGLGLYDPELVRPLVESHLTMATPPNSLASLSIVSFLANAPDVLYTYGVNQSLVRKVIVSINFDQPSISRPAREARDLLKSVPPFADDDDVQGAL